jgi:hypothetical protein
MTSRAASGLEEAEQQAVVAGKRMSVFLRRTAVLDVPGAASKLK